ncbi:MAG TPA: CotH kinase family protein [Candidatus Binatia bacterium]|nr:CotH kinase family protein [Candidatus Binatia bacterium]
MQSRIVIFVVLALLARCSSLGAPLTNATVDFEPNLPLIFLDAKEQIVSDRKVPCTVKLVSPGQTNTASPLTGVVRFHGATSQAYEKKSFGLTIDKPVALAGLSESAHYVLNAAFVDRSLMRHKLSYDLFRSLSSPGNKRFAAASRFVEVYFNGKYRGAYLLMERVDRRLLQLHPYSSNEVSHAVIYKAIDHAANFGQSGHAGYEQREPDPAAVPYWRPLDEFNKFVSSAPDAQFFDPQTGISSRLDLDNAIDFHLLVLLTSNMDGITKNFIFTRDATVPTNPHLKFFFAPWDYDATFGRNWEASRVAPTAWLSNHLFDRLLGNPAYRDRFVARWKELRDKQFSVKTVRQMIDDNAKTLGDAALRNAQRWRAQAASLADRLSFEEDIKEMKDWIADRIQWLDGAIAKVR